MSRWTSFANDSHKIQFAQPCERRLVVKGSARKRSIGAFALTRVLRSLLFDVSTTDPRFFAGAAILVAIVSLIATYIPARRALGVDATSALRDA